MGVFPQALLDALRDAPGTPVFEHGGRTVSRGELLELIRRLTGAMRGAGLGPGRGLAIRTDVSPEAFAAHMAAHALGCRVVGIRSGAPAEWRGSGRMVSPGGVGGRPSTVIRPGYPEAQLAHVLGMGADAVLLDAAAATPEMLRAAGSIPLLSLGPCRGAVDLLAVPDDGRPLTVTARPDDVAALTFTSGSTGRPKGCAITYRALSEHWAWQPDAWGPTAAELARGFERYLLFGTLASMVVLEFLAPCVLGGGTAVIPQDDAQPMFPYAIERHGITGSIITVPRLTRMLDILRREPVDVSSLRALMVSGSPLSPSRLAAAVGLLGPVVYHGYGQTEAGNIAMVTPRDIAERPSQALASVGRPHPGVQISIRNEQGGAVPAGTTGEIHVRSPYIMAGYWGESEETRDTLKDGWLNTRDLGHLDPDGFLYLTGRTRDVIMVNAMVVYAGPIERVLAEHPDVEEAYVVGAPDDEVGEAVHAFVVPAPGREPDGNALRELVAARLGADSVPRTVTVVPGVPVTDGGKPDKRALLGLHGAL
ncbi:AMP-dependent synthetase [Actinomadura sp. NBRC 104412]|uniref:class I adenylate-forming enzyme family protein n=1 Tax=Actinomadura sp. NBRC 104412 TaxID=3032203 RepID=UPI0024A45215|nr:fatty acid--CoA ligase family protein [Actinomadura sp. NBRC 104412]GLZ05224.1 AMP-dependent synthetase [Actinomadura sp. NBRC 104412]